MDRSGLTIQLYKPKPIKHRLGILYLLESDAGIYKLGVTQGRVRDRAAWASRKIGVRFTILETRVVKKPFKAELKWIWCIFQYIEPYNQSREFFTLRPSPDGMSIDQVIQAMEIS